MRFKLKLRWRCWCVVQNYRARGKQEWDAINIYISKGAKKAKSAMKVKTRGKQRKQRKQRTRWSHRSLRVVTDVSGRIGESEIKRLHWGRNTIDLEFEWFTGLPILLLRSIGCLSVWVWQKRHCAGVLASRNAGCRRLPLLCLKGETWCVHNSKIIPGCSFWVPRSVVSPNISACHILICGSREDLCTKKVRSKLSSRFKR